MRSRIGWGALATLALLALAARPAVSAYRRYRNHRARARLSQLLHDPLAGDHGWRDPPDADPGEALAPGEGEGDDALRRMIDARIRWGVPTAEVTLHLARVARAEALRWRRKLPVSGAVGRPLALQGSSVPVTGQS